jgi:carbon storage regulator
MLVLSRRIGEKIVIAGNIHLTVVAVKGKRVRLGVTAPASVPVARLELLAECSGGAASGSRSGPFGTGADSAIGMNVTTFGQTYNQTSTEKVAARRDGVAGSG